MRLCTVLDGPPLRIVTLGLGLPVEVISTASVGDVSIVMVVRYEPFQDRDD